MSDLSLADRGDILETLARVGWSVDESLPDLFVAQFTADAVVERVDRGGGVRRWSAVGGTLVDLLAAEREGVFTQDSQTWNSDAIFEPDGEAVRVITSSLRIGSSAGGCSNVILADTEVVDRVVRTDAGWRIASRRVTPLGVDGAAEPGGSEPLSPVPRLAGPAGDRAEIEALFADYAWAIDTADIDAVVGLFSRDAVMQDPFGRFTGQGPDGFAAFFEMLFARAEFAGRIHWVSQLVLTPTDDGYRADSYALVPAAYPSGGVNLHLMAFYRDIVVREDGMWRFRERLVGPRWERLDGGSPQST